jgi:hypothetical protein
MKYKLSIILPGIRTKNWEKFYQSILNSFSDTFELIIISPYNLPKSLKGLDNVSIYHDYGSPSRCQQIGLIHSKGEFVTWGADDGWFLENRLDDALKFWEANATCDKDIVTCKYTEGNTFSPEMLKDDYYRINHANGLRSTYIPNEYWILNVGLLKTQYAKEIGGWDAKFEVTTLSHMDFAVRTQRDGSNYFMLEAPIFACDHMPGTEGDHAPVHYSHVEYAEPLFRETYNNSSSEKRVKIELNNWEKTPEIWKRRF